jgi:polyisoprenyl-phosphate glycosyltransferase
MENKNDIMYSVVIPVFNEQHNLTELYERLTKVMSSQDGNYEIIFVDDGSKDNTPAILKELHHQDNRVKIIFFSRNFGQPTAISAGLKACCGKLVVLLDADLQNPPEEIPRLIKEMDNGYDIVYGLRRHRKDPLLRRLASQTLYWYMTKIANIRLPEGISAFKVMNRRTVEQLNLFPEKTKLYGALSSWLGARYKCIDVEHSPRKRGKSGYSILKLVYSSLDMQMAFSALPLRWIGISGIFFVLASIIIGLYWGISRLFNTDIMPGYISIIVAMMFFSGLILFSLSIIGEYISRIYTEIQGRPNYIVRETLGCSIKEERDKMEAS